MTDTFDFNSAPAQRSFDMIPDDTIAVLHMHIRPGGAGEGGLLKRSKNGDSEGLDAEFTVVEGEYAKRKFWTWFTLTGTTDGHAKAAEISAAKLRAILESARGVSPDDITPAALQARRVESFADFNNIRFIARIGVEPPENGFKAKNVLAEVVTPNRVGWRAVEQVAAHRASATTSAAPATTAAAPAGTVKRPPWAL